MPLLYTEFSSIVYAAHHRNADRPLHLVQGWDEGSKWEADFTPGLSQGVRKGTDISSSPFLHTEGNCFLLQENC